MKTTLLLLLFLFSQSICFSQSVKEDSILQTNTFFVWEVLDLQQAENTGFTYQDCDFMVMLLQSVKLGIIRPCKNDLLQIRLPQEDFLSRINSKNTFNKIILKSKVSCQTDKIIYQEVVAISIYSKDEVNKIELICAFGYEELKQNLLTENSEAMICLGEGLRIPLVEVFENHSFTTKFLRKVKID